MYVDQPKITVDWDAIDWDRVDEAALAILLLGLHDARPLFALERHSLAP